MQLSGTQNQLILACHITGIYDINRNNVLPNDDFNIVKEWAESIMAQQLYGVIFHNSFSEETTSKYQNKHISFIKVDYDARFNPNVFRYLVYNDFLKTHHEAIESLFLTDIADVVLVSNPFSSSIFIENPNTLFCGDEPKQLDNDWMRSHSAHLRSKIKDYAAFEEEFKNETLLNCGVIGGSIKVMNEFIEKLSNIHQQYNFDNKTAFTGDMGAFNYLGRTQFNDRLAHGFPCNTVFKEYQTERNDCWFRHK